MYMYTLAGAELLAHRQGSWLALCIVAGAELYVSQLTGNPALCPVHLLRVSLLRVLESNFPGDSL